MLNIRKDGTYLDATAGGGGHSREILSILSDRGLLVCSDRDEHATEMLQNLFDDNRVMIKKTRFSRLKETMASSGIDKVDGVLFDLGISMFQLKEKNRGFSFDSDARLDMRMGRDTTLSAWNIVNSFPQKEIERILRDYSDERYYRRIARAIVYHRKKKKIDTCRELADIIARSYGRRGRIHPATRTFQAIRIAVNDEIEELNMGLRNSMELLRSRGRLCIISYHSIEDRTVKHFIRNMAKDRMLSPITKKPVTPLSDEIRQNPAARSAKLRGAEKI